MTAPDLRLSTESFCTAFPFHVVLDEELTFVQIGTALRRVCEDLALGGQWSEAFDVLKPSCVELDFDGLKHQASTVFLVRHRHTGLDLRGAFVAEADPALLFFLASPWVVDVGQLPRFGLSIVDYPPHDASADFLFMVRARESAIQDARQLASELRRRTDQHLEAVRTAESASAAKSQFLANVSHELRTPMNGILGMAELLCHSELAPSQRECADTIHQSANTLLRLIGELLDLAKLDGGELDLVDGVLDVRALVRQVISDCEQERPRSRVAVGYQVDHDVPAHVRGDVDRLRQVLLNLLDNALRFTIEGHIVVQVRRVVRDGDAEWLEFEVQDTGVGIDQEDLGSIFAPFFQVDGSRTRRRGGAGLGLCVSQRLVQLMDGDIDVESALRVGSRFWFRVPLRAASDYLPPSASEPSGERLLRGRVLLVEDNAVNQLVIKRMLIKLGCDVEVADHGADAFDRVQREAFDLVLMDLQMPVMDGLEATRRIRGLGGPAGEVPIVAVTANALRRDRDACIEAGAQGYLTKPCRMKMLEDVLLRFLPSSAVDPWLVAD